MKIHIYHNHRVEFDEGSDFVNLVRALHHNQGLLLQRTELIMAQIDDLLNILQAVASDVSAKAQQLADLEQKLTDLQNTTPPTVDLQPAIDLATSIRQSLEGTADQASSAVDTTTSSTDTSQPADPGVADQPVDDTAGQPVSSPSVDGSEADQAGTATDTGTTDGTAADPNSDSSQG